jgi:hypothetical protein
MLAALPLLTANDLRISCAHGRPFSANPPDRRIMHRVTLAGDKPR